MTTDNNQQQEYLTDVVEILRGDGHPIGTVLAADAAEIQGVNDRVQLAAARRALNDRILEHWMRAGVTIVDPATTWVDVTVTIGQDAEIGPQVQLDGRHRHRRTARRVGPGCLLEDTDGRRGRRAAARGLPPGRDRASASPWVRSPTCGRAPASARTRTSAPTWS